MHEPDLYYWTVFSMYAGVKGYTVIEGKPVSLIIAVHAFVSKHGPAFSGPQNIIDLYIMKIVSFKNQTVVTILT